MWGRVREKGGPFSLFILMKKGAPSSPSSARERMGALIFDKNHPLIFEISTIPDTYPANGELESEAGPLGP